MLLKDLKLLKKDMAEIKAVLVGNLQKDSEELKQIKEYLSLINLQVKNVVETIDSTGRPIMKITYDAPKITLSFDSNGNVIENKVFKAINGLGLIKIDDQIALAMAISSKKTSK